ncbi:MAG: hypothetical protein JWQ65_2725 [Devosia sp.]|nr:hypothetical protein [Devosia sp.]
MIAQHYRLYIERKDAGQNMARFYALSIEETLFGQICLVRRWGRIGTRGRTVQHSFDDEGEAVALFLDLLIAKRTRGYRPRPDARHAQRPRLVDGAAAGADQSRLGRDQMSRRPA